MNDEKTREQLEKELAGMRRRISELESDHRRADQLILQSILNWEETFNNITDMITIHDKDYNIIHANKAAEKILGLSFLNGAKAKCYKHYHGEGSPPTGCPSCQCLKTGEPVIFERYEPHLKRYVEIRAMPQFDNSNQLIGLIHIVRDITERKQMEEALRRAHDELEMRVNERTAELMNASSEIMTANEEMLNEIAVRVKVEKALRESESKFKKLSQEFNVLLDAIPDNIVLLSPELKIMWANKAASSELSYDKSHSRRQYCYRMCSNFSSNQKSCPTLMSFITGREENGQVSSPDGRFLDVRAFPIADESGKVKSVIEVARDITVRVRMEEESRLIQAKLIHANKMTSLGTLVSGVAHEINNPNTFIKSNAQFIAKTWKDVGRVLEKFSKKNGDFLAAGLPYSEVQRLMPEVIKGIDDGSVRIQEIVNNLRNFAKPEKANLDGKVNVNDIVVAAKTILNNHINKCTAKFQLICGKNIPSVRGSSQQIEQVVINLIMNSLESLKDKSCGVRVSTSYNKKSKYVIIRVKDEGVGMTRDTLERITEPFFTTKLERGGTGLGLSISYAIIKEHRGTLEFESEYRKGTTATVKLPVYNIRQKTKPVSA
ncbi:MAG: PAS domain-containing protein [Nitrospirae bacterium]|nr:PAS domain-containing protein [Nitrospirota bacterium]